MHWLQNKREEMSKDISCHLRALKLLFCYNREWALVGLTILMDSLSPFVVIYLSSMLLEALYEQRPIREMLVWAAAGAGTALFINVVRHWAAKHKNVMWWGLQYLSLIHIYEDGNENPGSLCPPDGGQDELYCGAPAFHNQGG